MEYIDYFEDNIIKCDLSYRGGVVKIDLSELLPKTTEASEEDISAGTYQNYLGGGISGSIQIGTDFDENSIHKDEKELWNAIRKELIEYHYMLNNGGGDDYMQENHGTLEEVQNRAVSGF